MLIWDIVARLLIAAVCGGVVGIERGRKNRPAGFRTYILVCIGAALTMVLGQYLFAMESLWRNAETTFPTTDISRFGAQVINGIGFLGAGFYMGALICCAFIILAMVFFTRLESFVISHSRNINLYVEFEDMDDLSNIVEQIRSRGVRIFDVEITKAKYSETKYPNAIFSLRLPKKMTHSSLVTLIASVDKVRTIEEL